MEDVLSFSANLSKMRLQKRLQWSFSAFVLQLFSKIKKAGSRIFASSPAQAPGQTRTGDLRITNALLYRLSHGSTGFSKPTLEIIHKQGLLSRSIKKIININRHHILWTVFACKINNKM